MRQIKALTALFAVAFLVGCGTLYTSTVTITSVVDAAMKDWAEASVAGKTTPALDAQVTKAHDQYRASCATAQQALVAYKATGDQGQYVAALTAVRAAATGILDMITPFITTPQATELSTKLSKATKI